jgi:pimeloyl-ACP methyl ester carboxylesterase
MLQEAKVKPARHGGIGLAYDDIGRGEPIVLVHGGEFGRAFAARQAEALRTCHRVVSVDLRRRGAFDAPEPISLGNMTEESLSDLSMLMVSVSHPQLYRKREPN